MSDPITSTGASLECGWGRLIFGHTYPGPESVAREILREAKGKRDIALYITDPHIVLNTAPQALFLDPSHTFRINFSNYTTNSTTPSGISVGTIHSEEEIAAINRIYRSLNMVEIDPAYVWSERDNPQFFYAVARNQLNGEVLGAALGVDHMRIFDDIENGSSLWSLGVDPQATLPGVGKALVQFLIEEFQRRGRSQMDLSVLGDNTQAINLYEKLGFRKVAVFAVKRCNPINEKLYIDESPSTGYNPYARIIIEEALRRGIHVHPDDPPRGYFTLTLGGRSIVCRESLSEMTSAVAMSRCSDKALTRNLLAQAQIKVPSQKTLDPQCSGAEAFLQEHSRVVVKPAEGEQGNAVAVDLRSVEEIRQAAAFAAKFCDTVLIEQFVEGEDLRIIIINGQLVAAAVRKPPAIIGTGSHTVRQLIEKLSRRRASATNGESSIPLDEETERCVRLAGYAMESILPDGVPVTVRKTANLHTGGTIHDVTEAIHPALAEAAILGAATLKIPVVGFDLIVPSIEHSDYVIIEANERPGLANHEPQPTAERFIDFLFPNSIRT